LRKVEEIADMANSRKRKAALRDKRTALVAHGNETIEMVRSSYNDRSYTEDAIVFQNGNELDPVRSGKLYLNLDQKQKMLEAEDLCWRRCGFATSLKVKPPASMRTRESHEIGLRSGSHPERSA
jgi:hypothetical protein